MMKIQQMKKNIFRNSQTNDKMCFLYKIKNNYISYVQIGYGKTYIQ